jgi:hypothetical protein
MITWESWNQESQLFLFCLNKYRTARGKVHRFCSSALEKCFDGDQEAKILVTKAEMDNAKKNLSVVQKPSFIDQQKN